MVRSADKGLASLRFVVRKTHDALCNVLLLSVGGGYCVFFDASSKHVSCDKPWFDHCLIALLRVGSIADALGDIKPRPLVAASGGGGIGVGFGIAHGVRQ